MTYRYKVTLSGIKGFFRVYRINGNNSLYSFHKQMRADMGFPPDQLILFKAFDRDSRVVARYGLFDLGAGTVDDITISDSIKAGVVSFVYFYDVENKKSVNISFEGEDTAGDCQHPVLVEAKGPDPIEFENGFVAYEDLPDEQRHLPGEEKSKRSPLAALLGIDSDEVADDDDDDEEEEEDDREEDETVYDENEGMI